MPKNSNYPTLNKLIALVIAPFFLAPYVIENIGGYGVAGILKNGNGAVEQDGQEVGVMHACGHDVHMTVWVGTAQFLSSHKNLWSGTLLFIAQPAEERGAGAAAMLADDLFAKTAQPDYALALHVTELLPAGNVALCRGFALANVDSVDWG